MATPLTPEAQDALSDEPQMLPDGSAIVADEEGAIELEEQPDGSVFVPDETPAKVGLAADGDWLENLADKLPSDVLSRLGQDLVEKVRRDGEDRAERDKQYAEGLQRTGLGKDAPGGANFQGASQVVHPMLTEGCIDFAARVMKEVFPAKGPVKTHLVGKPDRKKLERADRKRKFMNWQMTKQIREMRGQFEIMLTQVPLGGSQYLKVWHDPRFARPRAEFVPVDDIRLPYAASDFDSAERKTHVQRVTRMELEARVESGLYRGIVLDSDAPGSLDKTAAATANEKIEGKSDTAMNEDGQRLLFEIYVLLELAEDPRAKKGRVAPYIVTVDEQTGQVAAVYRNWDETDKLQQELPWIAEAKFVPWRGAYGLGLINLAGSLSAGATGALRALLDSAHINNFPGALKLKGSRLAGQSKSTEPTEITEIEGPTGIDDIRKLAMPFPYNQPSAVLFELMKFMVDSGKGIIATAEEKIADVTANAPVGTTLAVIEQGSVTYSSVHSRMHATMARVLEILHRIDRDFLDDEMVVEELGDLVAKREDFQGPMDVIPVSDPNIFSETQRYAQLQAVLQLRTQFQPGTFKDDRLIEQAMRLLNVPEYEDLLNTPLEAEERDAIEENFVSSEPQSQLEVYVGQDHLAHLQAHVTFMASPIFVANPLMAAPALPNLMQHCRKHLMEYYRQNVRAAAVAIAESGAAFEEVETRDQLLAAAAGAADRQMAAALEPIVNAMQKLQQQMQQLMPTPPDPALQAAQIQVQGQQAIEDSRQKAETEREALRMKHEASEAALVRQEKAMEQQKAEQAEAARHTEEMAVANQNAVLAEQSEQRAQQIELAIERMREQAETMRNAQDNQTRIIVEQISAAMAARQEAHAAEIGAKQEAHKTEVAAGQDKLGGMLEELRETAREILRAKTSATSSVRARRTPEGLRVEALGEDGATVMRTAMVRRDPATGELMVTTGEAPSTDTLQ